ncbi:MAG TPA: phage holin family protein [Steroidobacteraceae bacterium]|nr:phage holin family protein [Steroidobacteraceae bacterium]
MSVGAAPEGLGPSERHPPLQGLASAALDALRTRLELAAVELEIQLIGLVRALICALAAILCVLVALAFAVVALIETLWNSHRVLGLLGGGIAFLVIGVACALIGVHLFHRRPGILRDSVEQLDRDRRRTAPP